MEKYPRVLVIAHNPFSDSQNNGKTLSAFFKGWPKRNIAQIYLTPEKPDMTVCERFFRITDLEVIRSFLGKKAKQPSEEVSEKNVNEKKIRDVFFKCIQKAYSKKIPFLDFIRNIVWEHVKPWRNKSVKDWIKDFNPDVIFFQTSNLYAIFDMVQEIKEYTKANLFLETTDDYVTKYFSLNPFYIFNINKNIKMYSKLAKAANKVFVIGDLMLEEYEKRFEGNYVVAMNSIEINGLVRPYNKVENKKITIIYAGNLGLNRWKVLAKIGKAIKEINRKKEVCVKLNIYSINEPNRRIKKRLTILNASEYKGSLNSSELIEARNNADILLHVESFDKKSSRITRLSVSTKIPEYMLSKRCILAVGPKEVASIKYIRENNIGKAITKLDKTSLENDIYEFVNDKEKMNMYINRAIEVANVRHNFNINRKKVQNEILNLKR